MSIRRVPVPWHSLLLATSEKRWLSSAGTTAVLWGCAVPPGPVLPAVRAALRNAGVRCAGSNLVAECRSHSLAAWQRLRHQQLKSWLRRVEELEQRLVAVTSSLTTLPSGQARSASGLWEFRMISRETSAKSVKQDILPHRLLLVPGISAD